EKSPRRPLPWRLTLSSAPVPGTSSHTLYTPRRRPALRSDCGHRASTDPDLRRVGSEVPGEEGHRITGSDDFPRWRRRLHQRPKFTEPWLATSEQGITTPGPRGRRRAWSAPTGSSSV